MLENFSDEEIADLLEIGYLYLPAVDSECIEKRAITHVDSTYLASVYAYSYVRKGDGERQTNRYRKLPDLLFCESISFDDLRREWRYHGVLLGHKTFCDKLVHDTPCPCGVCTNRLTD